MLFGWGVEVGLGVFLRFFRDRVGLRILFFWFFVWGLGLEIRVG